MKEVQRAGNGDEHKDGHDAVPKQCEEQQPKGGDEAAVGGTDDGAATVVDVPRAFRRMVQVEVGAEVAAGSQLGEAIGDIAVAAIGNIVGNVDFVRRNRPAAPRTDRRGRGERFNAILWRKKVKFYLIPLTLLVISPCARRVRNFCPVFAPAAARKTFPVAASSVME